MTGLAVSLIWLLLAAPPAPTDPTQRVHDFANLLSFDQRQSLETLARGIETETTAQLAIVTVRSLDGRTVEQFANELFNQWGIGRRDVNNGVLLLVAPHEHKLRIEVGYGLEPLLTDSLCGEIRDESILPYFRNQDFPRGIRAGAERIIDVLRRYPQAAAGVPGSAPIWVRTAKRDALAGLGGVGALGGVMAFLASIARRRRNYSTVVFFIVTCAAAALAGVAALLVWKAPQSPLLWGCAAATGGGLVWALWTNYRRYHRFGPNACRKCGTRLELLDEQADDAKLSTVQQLEERLGSVDYDVWFCPACLQSETESYLAWFSGFLECPSCKARAFREGPQEVIRPATQWSSGTARVVDTCSSCKKRRERLVTLPMIGSSSGSGSGGSSFSGGGGGGGSSFGGGSSGGGGASGSW